MFGVSLPKLLGNRGYMGWGFPHENCCPLLYTEDFALIRETFPRLRGRKIGSGHKAKSLPEWKNCSEQLPSSM